MVSRLIIMGSLILGAVGVLLAAGIPLSPELIFGLGALPLLGMPYAGNGSSTAEIQDFAQTIQDAIGGHDGNGDNPPLGRPDPEWLMW
ncbi:MAG: hypothetical protein KC643_22725, partial [Nitrospira sp.]|nr:hypothetical protein [Nitrospira sp.]